MQILLPSICKGWFPYDRRRSQTIADDRGSQIADDCKESCFHMIADDRKQSQSRLLHTFRTAELSKLHARCAGGKIAANNMADVEEEILLQANLFLLFVNLFWNSLGTASHPDPEGSVFNRFRLSEQASKQCIRHSANYPCRTIHGTRFKWSYFVTEL